MQIQINSPHIDIPAAFVDFIERRLGESLAPFAHQLTRVEVHFKDENGGKGGKDKRCTLEARPRHMDPLVVEVVSDDLKDSLRQATEKLRHALEHRIGKLSRHQRGA